MQLGGQPAFLKSHSLSLNENYLFKTHFTACVSAALSWSVSIDKWTQKKLRPVHYQNRSRRLLFQWPYKKQFLLKEFYSLIQRKNFSRVLRHSFHSKFKFDDQELVHRLCLKTRRCHLPLWRPRNLALRGPKEQRSPRWEWRRFGRWEAVAVSVAELEPCHTKGSTQTLSLTRPKEGGTSTPLTSLFLSQGTRRPSQQGLDSNYRRRFHVSWKP